MASFDRDEIIITYLDESNVSESVYFDFLVEYYGSSRWIRYKKKKEWYSSQYPYRVLLAIVDGRLVGQSCVYQVPAVVGGEDSIISWGVDAFVLPAWQGCGIGKMLQKRLHEDNINFTSAWYSPVNGVIKRKCNANEYFRLYFPYYAVSKWLSVYLELVIKKLLNKEMDIPLRVPNIYYLLQTKHLNDFDFEEIFDFENSDITFIDKCLRITDFFVKRDMKYMQWKYFANPSLESRPHIIRVYSKSKQIAIFSFTNPTKSKYISASVIASVLLDCFVDRNSGLKERDILMYVVRYYASQGIVIDGIRSLQDIKYYPRIIYPLGGRPLLSTYNGNIDSYYLSLIDQDMEQIAI